MVSFLKSEGHHDPEWYPIWKLWHEVRIARKRINADLSVRTVAMFVALVAAEPKGKREAKTSKKMFDNFIKGLANG